MMFERASDEELRENGWDPTRIEHDSEGGVGPYAVTRSVFGWAVVNLETATGAGVEWTHEDGEVDATEHANALNAAWVAGYRSREVRQ